MTPERETELFRRLEDTSKRCDDIYNVLAGDGLHEKQGLIGRVKQNENDIDNMDDVLNDEKKGVVPRLEKAESFIFRATITVGTITTVCIVLGWVVELIIKH